MALRLEDVAMQWKIVRTLRVLQAPDRAALLSGFAEAFDRPPASDGPLRATPGIPGSARGP